MKSFPKIVIMVLAFMLVTAFAFSDDCETIEEDVFSNNTRPFVCFSHDDHNAAAELEDSCSLCHHTFDTNGKRMEDETSEDSTCSECHAEKDDPKQMALMTRYHDRCRSCHLERKSGPVTCGECHSKKR